MLRRSGSLRTQWEAGLEFAHGTFPAQSDWPRYAALAQQKLPKMGDISVRSALTIHRGTANHSPHARPAALHDQMVTREQYAQLRQRAASPHVLEELVPIVQKNTIEGLVMGVSP